MTTPAPRWVGWVLDWTEPEAEGRGAKGNGGQGVGQPSDFAVRHSIERGGETHGDGGTLVCGLNWGRPFGGAHRHATKQGGGARGNGGTLVEAFDAPSGHCHH